MRGSTVLGIYHTIRELNIGIHAGDDLIAITTKIVQNNDAFCTPSII